jgi:hypothetical protein
MAPAPAEVGEFKFINAAKNMCKKKASSREDRLPI